MLGKAFVTRSLALLFLFFVSFVAARATSIDLVTVGDVGNAGEWSGGNHGGYGPDRICGAVSYEYKIGKYEVTAGQYTEFLNAVSGIDTYRTYEVDMAQLDYGCGISRLGGGTSANPFTYEVQPTYVNRPVNCVSWGSAARFANWLHNGQPTGAQNHATTEDGAYLLNGAVENDTLIVVAREADWKWALSSEDEWYKAAYYKGGSLDAGYSNYPTGFDTLPGRDLTEATNPGNNANYAGHPQSY